MMGRSSLLVANAVPWGRVSGPAGLAPKLCRSVSAPAGFFRETHQRAGCLFQLASGNVPADLGGATRT
jgi:hypothetical protein